MRIFLTGVSCVGKTTIGRKLAVLLGVRFFDLDHETEAFFGKPIERLQDQFLTMHSFRREASLALENLLTQLESLNSVIALPPSGLMQGYYRLIKKTEGLVVLLTDAPQNILSRITFYDADSRLIEKRLTEQEKRHYLKEIKKDIAYFKQSYRKADLTVDITGLGPDESAQKLKDQLLEVKMAPPVGGKLYR